MTRQATPNDSQTPADRDALDWVVRRAGGGFTVQDEAAFQIWLTADAGHGASYARQQAEWTALDHLPRRGLDILRANLADDLAAAARPAQPARRRSLVPALSAAMLAMVLGGAAFIGWHHWQSQPVFAQSFGTQRGQQLAVPLPDGSQLNLDTKTRVQVTYYRHRREVMLSEGQAVFLVQGDKTRPFDVLAGPLRITVVGTKFAVRNTPGMAGHDGVQVAVEEGLVEVARLAGSTEQGGARQAVTYLHAGQQLASNPKGEWSHSTSVPSGGIAPWRDQLLSFDNVRLDQVLAELERYGDTRLVVRNPAVASLRVTGTFNPARLDSFARVLPHAAPVQLQVIGQGVAEVVGLSPDQ